MSVEEKVKKVVNVAVDIGNSETEMVQYGEIHRQPSVIKSIPTLPNVAEDKTERHVLNLMDQLTVHITSNAVKKNGLYYIGERAVQAGGQLLNMNILLGDKHKSDIPVIMTLAMIAAHEIQTYWEKNKALPESSALHIKRNLSSMIPASEFNREKADYLQNRFLNKNKNHVVIVYVGSIAITVTITFEKVKITQEGVPAHYKLIEGKQDVLAEFKKRYKDDDTAKAMKPIDFRNKSILMVNIGDGSTEYIYIKKMNPVPDACSGAIRGVGHATEAGIKKLKDQMGAGFSMSRQQFMGAYRNPEHNLHSFIQPLMDEEKQIQAEKILEDISEKVLAELAGDVQFILVYGGGSIELRDVLEKQLVDFARDNFIKVIWTPAKYAVDLDVLGLEILNDNVFFK